MKKGRMRSFQAEGGERQHLVVVPRICVTTSFFRRVRAYDVIFQAEGGIPCLITSTTSNTPSVPLTSSQRYQDNKVRLRICEACVKEREKREGKEVCVVEGGDG